MAAPDVDNQFLAVFLRIMLPILNSDMINALSALWVLAKRTLRFQTHEGMYEVLELDERLELLDDIGQRAVLYKREKVKFLQDNIIAYQDQAWGDGDIFADYKCSPGTAVDRYKDGYRYRILISLRGTKNRGDVEEFHIERRIENGFTKSTESFQVDVNHIIHNLHLVVVFPKLRPPKNVILVEQNTTRTSNLGPNQRTILADGREQITFETDKPRVFESYILRWEW